MNFTESLKNGACFVADTASEIAESIAEKNRLRAQLNHLKKLIKSDSATRDQAYAELGRFFYDNLREDASPENEALCAVIDTTSERITKASLKYVEVLNIQNETKIRSENAERLKKAMAEKAAIAADKAKVQGAQLARKTKEFAEQAAEQAKKAAQEKAEQAKVVAAQKAEQAKEFAKEKAEQAIAAAKGAKDATVEKVEDIVDKASETVDDIKTSSDIEALIAEEQQKIAEAEQNAVEELEKEAAAEKEKAEESPESFDF